LHSQGIETHDPSEITGSIRGRDNIYDHLEYQIKNAKESVTIATTEDGLVSKTKALVKQIKKAKERGIEITVAAPLSDKNKLAQTELGEYAKIKNSKNVNARFCVVDDTHVTVMLADDKEVHPSYDSAVWVQSPILAKTLLSTI
jgi:phosphatidylserine/phosphatidylglycerophosphate/cardiolipin synthase-like enzyme